MYKFGATKPLDHPVNGDGVSCRNVVKTSHPDAAVCLRKLIESCRRESLKTCRIQIYENLYEDLRQ